LKTRVNSPAANCALLAARSHLCPCSDKKEAGTLLRAAPQGFQKEYPRSVGDNKKFGIGGTVLTQVW